MALLCCQWGLQSVLRAQRLQQTALQWRQLAQLLLVWVLMSCSSVQKVLLCRPLSFLSCPMVQECHPMAQLGPQCWTGPRCCR